MAPPPGTLRVSRYFLALAAILAVLYTVVFFPGSRNTPKLGIDLVGGIRVIFTAQAPAGGTVTTSALEQARQIIEERINGNGVTASTVQTQGNDQLVVSIPGGTGADVERLGKAAQLNFRPLIAPAVGIACDAKLTPVDGAAKGSAAPSGSASNAPSSPATSGGATSAPTSGAPTSAAPSSGASTSGAGGNAASERRLTAPSGASSTAGTKASSAAPSGSTSGSATGSSTGSATPAPSASTSQAPKPCVKNPVAALKQADPTLTVPTTEADYSKLTATQKQLLQAVLQSYDCSSTFDETDNPKSYYIACDKTSSVAYLLGTVIVPGRQIDEASAQAPSTGGQGGSSKWTVALTLKDAGQTAWSNWTGAHNTNNSQSADPSACGLDATFPCNDFVAFTLDGQVLAAPATAGAINGTTQISGPDFTQTSTTQLADSLKFGALPLSFRTDSNERVSATLGTSQLQAALLAGGIGLILVVIYSLLYYRALGLVTIASLVVSGLLTYGMLVLLGEQIGFTLDLSGIAGLIVALGITADSFVVFFERIKDEVHEGRSVRVAVPRAWVRARRTILSADTVSFLAAAILYYFASADVKGFAFTLGLSTILDLAVVFLFTHPIVSLLSRSRAFGSARFTGLNSVRPGGITVDAPPPAPKRSATARAAERRGATATIDRPVDLDKSLDAADESSTDEQDTVRRTTTPEPGSAAERAAARRARKRNDPDASGTGEGEQS